MTQRQGRYASSEGGMWSEAWRCSQRLPRRRKITETKLRGNLVQQLEPSKMGPAAGGSSTLLVQQLEPSKMGPAAGYCLVWSSSLSPVKWDQLLGEALLYWSSSLSPVKWDQLLVTALMSPSMETIPAQRRVLRFFRTARDR
jgi:hypothetical protein